MNKRIVVLGLLVAIMSVSAFGAGFMGPPTAELEKGQWSIGYNYMYSDMDLEETKTTWGFFADDETVDFITDWVEDEFEIDMDDVLDELGVDDIRDLRVSFKSKIEDVKTQRQYATIGYGITDQWEVYFQLGFADVKGKAEIGSEWGSVSDSYNFDNDFAWGWGTRYTFYEQENIRWGVSAQMNWLDTSWDEKESWVGDVEGEEASMTYKNEINFETYDLLVAIGPTADMGGWKLYGGPFFYYLSGDYEAKETITLTYAGLSATAGLKGSGELENDSGFGGFIGAQFDAWENTALTTELAFTGDGWAISGGIAYKF